MNIGQERDLVKKAQAGDRQAATQLWDSITPKLFGYLVNVLRDKTLAEDVLQTTWLKAVEALPKFKQQGISISSWLFAIARNECRQHWRNTKNEPDQDITGLEVADDNQSNIQNSILVEQLLKDLSEDDRELLRLRYIADLPINDIAKLLNINFVAVRVRLHRAIARAKAILATQKI